MRNIRSNLWAGALLAALATSAPTPSASAQGLSLLVPGFDLFAAQAVVIHPPRPEVLCARVAAFGLVEPKTQRFGPGRGGGNSWECRPRLVLVEPLRTSGEVTSIYTAIRGDDDLAIPAIRFKVNALDPQTTPVAVAQVVGAAQSIARSFGIEIPSNLVAALAAMDRTDIETECVGLVIDPEWDDDRRNNIFIDLRPGCVRWPVRPAQPN